MKLYPYNPFKGQRIATNVLGVACDRSFIARLTILAAQAVAASLTAVHNAATVNAATVNLTTGITNSAYPRNITLTATGTAENVKAVQAVIEGTNYLDEAITETLPAFTIDTLGTVAGAKAFKTVTKITIPAMDGAVSVSVGFGDIMGLPYLLTENTVLKSYLGGTLEATAPTVTVSGTAIESNTIDFATALDGHDVDVYLMV